MEAIRTSEMFVSFCKTTQCNIPEDSTLHTCLFIDALPIAYVYEKLQVYLITAEFNDQGGIGDQL
jgi:hypothetical protein